jgi:hypothetical protein
MLDLQIREKIRAYVDGKVEAGVLEDWVETSSWDLDHDAPAHRLAADALRLLAEHSNGDWTDAELRGQLGALSRTYWFDQAPKKTRSGSIGAVIRQDQQSGSAGRWRVAESV